MPCLWAFTAFGRTHSSPRSTRVLRKLAELLAVSTLPGALAILHSASLTMPVNARQTVTLPLTLSTLTLTCSRRDRNASARPCTTQVRYFTPSTRVVHTHSFFSAPQVAFHVGNAQQLDPDKFPDNTYDLYTIAFGIRNCTSIPDVVKEAYRVLKPGGVLAVLEFSKVTQPVLAQ